MRKILNDYIEAHYENKDYTEVVRDALLCLTTEIRNKADLVDGDGIPLLNKVFSEKDPIIKINKLETESERNKQKGISDLSKGLIEYFRNPMSHDRQEYNKEIADAILTLLDEVILKEILGSKCTNGIESLFDEIKNELFPDTERYAKSLVDSVPKNKKFDLAILIYRNRAELIGTKNNLITELISNLEINKFKEYCKVIENDLFGDITKGQVELALLFININVWNELSELIRAKIEDMVLFDFSKFSYTWIGGKTLYSQIPKLEGDKLLENSSAILDFFSNKYAIYDAILSKIVSGNADESKYLTDNYLYEIISDKNEINEKFVSYILQKMNLKSRPAFFRKVKGRLEDINKNSKWYVALEEFIQFEDNKEKIVV